MRKVCFTIVASLIVIFGLLVSSSCAGEPSNNSLHISRLTVNESGGSIFVDEKIELNSWPSGFAMTSLEKSTHGVRFFKAKPGWEMLELHYAPKKQYLFVLQGVLEIQTNQNEIRQFNSGSILLVEDTYGKGHRTRNASNHDLILVWLSI